MLDEEMLGIQSFTRSIARTPNYQNSIIRLSISPIIGLQQKLHDSIIDKLMYILGTRISTYEFCRANLQATDTQEVWLCYYTLYLILNSWSVTLLTFHLSRAMTHLLELDQLPKKHQRNHLQPNHSLKQSQPLHYTPAYISLWLQIPCNYSQHTFHIHSTSGQVRIWNHVGSLWWIFFCGKSQCVKTIGCFCKICPPLMFDEILNATLFEIRFPTLCNTRES